MLATFSCYFLQYLFRNQHSLPTIKCPHSRSGLKYWNRCSGHFFKEIRKISFHMLVDNSFKIKWMPLGLLRHQKDMKNEIFCLKNHPNSPTTKYMFNVIKFKKCKIKFLNNSITWKAISIWMNYQWLLYDNI